MLGLLNAVLVMVIVLNLFALGTSRFLTLIRIVAAQGILLGAIPFLLSEHITVPGVLAAAAAVLLKGIAIPVIMMRALRSANIKREVEPLIGILPSIIIGAIGTALAILFTNQLDLTENHKILLVVPTSFATVFIGFIFLITRFKALSQVVGYLILENGIFIFGMLLVEAIPFAVEMGMLLDLFVCIFVISIIINHINRAFSSLDTRQLTSLKE